LEAEQKLNRRIVLPFFFVLVLCGSLVTGTHVASADSDNPIRFYAFTLFSPLNKTYASSALTLNLTFSVGMGVRYSLCYYLDGKYQESIPFVVDNPDNELHVVCPAHASTKLPELSDGSHSLTVFLICSGLVLHPPSYNGTVYFTINPSGRTPANALAGQWFEKTPMPTARFNFGAAAVNGTIYAIGGLAKVFDEHAYEHGRTGTTNVNEAYDTATDTWAEKMPMPAPNWLDTFGIAVYHGKIYCIGGPANNVYDPATDTWEAKKTMPTQRHFLCANVVDGKIYLIGGRTMEKATDTGDYWLPGLVTYNVSDVNEVYDPATNAWTRKASLPNPVASYASAVVNNKIYIISGCTSSGNITDLVQVYDPQTDNWSLATPIPNPVENAAAGAVISTASSAIYVIGGCTESHRDAGSKFNQAYFPENDSWLAATPISVNTRALSTAVINNTLYAIGGISDNASFYSSAVYQYSPTELTTTPHPTMQLSQSPTSPLLVIALVATVAAVIVSVAVLLWKKPSTAK
jgi:N-acetylneuraminic acid mutarotase